jgi:hypothetical protein
VTQDDILAALARLNVTPEERAREARLQGRLQEAGSGNSEERRQAVERALAVSSAGSSLLRGQMDNVWREVATGDRIQFEGTTMLVSDIERILMTYTDAQLVRSGKHAGPDVLEGMFERERERRLDATPGERAVRRAMEEGRADVEKRQAMLDFRIACDAVYTEGVLARSVGMDLGSNPYVGFEPAERICPGRMLGDFHLAWMLGWRAADEQDAIDALVVAAEAATRGGTVTPACPAGEGLREAVAALMARRLRS